ncbi:DUF6409 family protein [Kitasatospora sp. NPDC059648]|uniref:DUF6409 family protein n=1 Tax=Kitasatospora sp. NPDC059648 TaxID=3346894 RepID=UPI0036A51E03
MTATATQTLTAGTLVTCPHYRAGQNLGPARAVILGPFGDSAHLVWFYPKGPARQGDEATVSITFSKEITEITGTLADLSQTTLRRIITGSHQFPDAHTIWQTASTLRARKRAARHN